MTLSAALSTHSQKNVEVLEDFSPHPVEVIQGNFKSGILLLCDHASNHVPDDLKQLGLPDAQFERHIGYDIGAAQVTRLLAGYLKAPAALTQFSRLVIDPNRGRDDPTLVMRLSDGAVVPGNAYVNSTDIHARITRFYEPYDRVIRDFIAQFQIRGINPLIISIHSFTPVWRGVPRPWQIGFLWHEDKRLTDFLITQMQKMAHLTIGDNEPYAGGLPGDTIDRHATKHGFANTLIELRQDLIADEAGARSWAERLAPLLVEASGQKVMHEIRHIP
ncbi:N-formylglutamate amidohydrolase [Microvirga sp. W0021]|uniref:N-formylglutamate amidohydrolase n=1 Tax=Hohaiivirga grylli TaxID=3133970 RepID=A0ABV0BJJ2_9HYPH